MNDDLDIRPSLRSRLKSVDAQLVELAQRREALVNLRRSIEQTLAQEDALRGNSSGRSITIIRPAMSSAADLSSTSIGDTIMQHLASGPKTLGQLKEALGRLPILKDHNSPGRAINFALVGLQRGGRVDRLENESWKLASGANRKGSGAPALTGAPRE